VGETNIRMGTPESGGPWASSRHHHGIARAHYSNGATGTMAG
jgi:hypothetical protein